MTSDEDPDETGESSEEGYDSSDDYDPFEGCEDSSNQPEATADCGRIFLVAEKHFTELFRVCRECLASCQIDIQCEGTVVEVYTHCPSDHRGYWINQDVIHQQPLLNLLIAAGILFAGCNPKASLRILSSIGVQTICCRTFFNLQHTHLFPAIEKSCPGVHIRLAINQKCVPVILNRFRNHTRFSRSYRGEGGHASASESARGGQHRGACGRHLRPLSLLQLIHLSLEQDVTSPAQLDIDPQRPGPKQRQLSDFLAEYSDCFVMSSKVCQTTVAKHRIVAEDDVLPVHR
ncbi:hypothetical protein ISCGN_027108 [Ixodes scapularis]